MRINTPWRSEAFSAVKVQRLTLRPTDETAMNDTKLRQHLATPGVASVVDHLGIA
jgi:hypothetical protein